MNLSLKFESAARTAATLIFNEGPKTREQLYIAANFGNLPSRRAETLAKAINDGWLELRDDGSYDITQEAYEALEREDRPASRKDGQVALPRQIDVMNRPAYVPPPKRIPRDDEPIWSRRAAVGA